MTQRTTSGGSSRFSDSPLAFGLERFTSSGESRFFWVFTVRKFCGGDILHEEKADIRTLAAMQRWIEKAIIEVRTDGGRIDPEKPEETA